jgi:hypothetical protein
MKKMLGISLKCSFCRRRIKTFVILIVFIFSGLQTFPLIKINSDFENGHFVKYRIQGDTIFVGPVSGHADTWFNFKISGVKHRNIFIVFEWINKNPIYPGNFNGAINNTGMVSYDGKGFELLKNTKYSFKDPANTSGNYIETISHTFRENEATVCYCAPWSNTKMANLAKELGSDKRVEVLNIGYSKIKNLPLTYFKITDKSVPEKNKKKIFLTGREDAYEAGGSWAIEGLMRFILSDDPVAKEMLKKMVFIIFPIFSVDGVAMGTTNFPLDERNQSFVYVTAYWDREQPYYEVKLMKDFWNKLKNENFEPDIAFKFHSTCYWQSHFRPEDCAPENKDKELELLKILMGNLPWRQRDPDLSDPKIYMNYNFIKVFPNAISYSSHNDFIFSKIFLNSDKPVYRRHEDVMQDGELIARSFAKYYGIPSGNVAPYLMAGDVDKNCGKKGAELTWSVYYWDINELKPSSIEVVINGKTYKMIPDGNPDFKKPVKYIFKTILDNPTNDYYFRASNGKKERKIPEDNYQLPGPFILN